MRFVYKGCTYRTETLTEAQKKQMEKEIEKAYKRLERLKITAKQVKSIPGKKVEK